MKKLIFFLISFILSLKALCSVEYDANISKHPSCSNWYYSECSIEVSGYIYYTFQLLNYGGTLTTDWISIYPMNCYNLYTVEGYPGVYTAGGPGETGNVKLDFQVSYQNQIPGKYKNIAIKVGTSNYPFGSWSYTTCPIHISITAPTVTGPNPLCYSGGTYTISNYTPYDLSSIEWVKSSNITITGSSYGTSINARAIYPSECSGGWLHPIYHMTCGTELSCPNKTVWVGIPKVDYEDDYIIGGYAGYPSPFPCIYTYNIRYGVQLSDYIQSATSYDWSGLVQSLLEYGKAATFYPVNLGPPYYGSGYIQVVGINQCGSSVPVSAGYGPCGGGFMALPNPADSYVDVDIDPEKFNPDKLDIGAKCDLIIYNNTGIAKYTAQFKDFPNRINTESWQEGVYFIQIQFVGENYSLPITIKH